MRDETQDLINREMLDVIRDLRVRVAILENELNRIRVVGIRRWRRRG